MYFDLCDKLQQGERYFLFGFGFLEGLLIDDFDGLYFFVLEILDFIASGKSSLAQKLLLGVSSDDGVGDLVIFLLYDFQLGRLVILFVLHVMVGSIPNRNYVIFE